MNYGPTTDPKFLKTVESWFQTRPEILVLIRYSHSAGSRAFEFFSSFDQFSNRLKQLPCLACVTAFKQPQLPLRGVVDEKFVARCLKDIPDGTEYLVTEMVPRVYGDKSWFHHASGESHLELQDDLEESLGVQVAAGTFPPLVEGDEDVISAVVPDEHGLAGIGIY